MWQNHLTSETGTSVISVMLAIADAPAAVTWNTRALGAVSCSTSPISTRNARHRRKS